MSAELPLDLDGAEPFLVFPSRAERIALGLTRPSLPADTNLAFKEDPHGADPAGRGATAHAPLLRILRKRREQIERGYTPDSDLKLPIGLLAGEAGRYLVDARDWLGRPAKDPQRRHFELKLVNAAALILAELDRLDAARAAGEARDLPFSFIEGGKHDAE